MTLLWTTSLVTWRVNTPLVSVCCVVIIMPSVGNTGDGACVYKNKQKNPPNSPEFFDKQRREWYLRSRGRWPWCGRRWSVCWPPWASGKPPSSSWTGCCTETRHLQGRTQRNTCQCSMSASRRWESHKKIIQVFRLWANWHQIFYFHWDFFLCFFHLFSCQVKFLLQW